MSEPRYRVEQRGSKGHWLVLWSADRRVTDKTTRVIAACRGEDAHATAERLAALLTADDERIAREGHRKRLAVELGPFDGSPRPTVATVKNLTPSIT